MNEQFWKLLADTLNERLSGLTRVLFEQATLKSWEGYNLDLNIPQSQKPLLTERMINRIKNEIDNITGVDICLTFCLVPDESPKQIFNAITGQNKHFKFECIYAVNEDGSHEIINSKFIQLQKLGDV